MRTLEDYRAEYQRVGVGPLLYELLGRIVWSTARTYPPSEYSAYGTWNRPACEDVLHDWISERLWRRADLQAMLSSARNVGQLRAALTTSLGQYLVNKRRRSIASNLYKRVRSMLRDDPTFRAVTPASLGPGQEWTLTERAATDPSPLAKRDLLRVASELGDDSLEVIRYGPFSQKLSPILRDPKLREFLVYLLGRAEGSLSLSAIVDVMRCRFSLSTEEQIELDETVPAADPDPGDDAVVDAIARSVVSRLEIDESRLLAAYFAAQGSLGEAAKACGTPLQLRKAVYRAFEMICECADTVEEAGAIMRATESLLHERGE